MFLFYIGAGSKEEKRKKEVPDPPIPSETTNETPQQNTRKYRKGRGE
jgi:hypothetical protein